MRAGEQQKTRDRVDIQLIDACRRPYKGSTCRTFQKTSRKMGPSSFEELEKE